MCLQILYLEISCTYHTYPLELYCDLFYLLLLFLFYLLLFFWWQALECLVRLASVRRSLFSNDAARSKFLAHLMTGCKEILQAGQGTCFILVVLSYFKFADSTSSTLTTLVISYPYIKRDPLIVSCLCIIRCSHVS